MLNTRLRLVAPRVAPVLDAAFRPPALANRAFGALAAQTGRAVPVRVALEQANGSIEHFATNVLPEDHPDSGGNFPHVERWLKFLLWSRGGFRIHFAGPASLAEALAGHYRAHATGKFDAEMMGGRIYERPFEVR